MANYRFIKDRSFHMNIANRGGRVVDLDLYQGTSFMKNLVAGLDADTIELNTSSDPQDTLNIPVGTNYRVRITNQADPSEWSVMNPAPFDMVDDYEQAVPSMLWANDEGFEFAANGRCYLESQDLTEDPVDGGETASDLYINDPVGGVVGRAHSKKPAGNALIPDHRLRQSTSADKPLLALDANGRLFWNLQNNRQFELVPADGAIANISAFHFIFAVRENSSSGTYQSLLGGNPQFLFRKISGNPSFESNLGSDVSFDSGAGDPDLFDFEIHIVELLLYKDAGAGQSQIRIDQTAKNCDWYLISLAATAMAVGYSSGYIDSPDLYSFGMKGYEVTGLEYDDWYNYHLTQAGGTP